MTRRVRTTRRLEVWLKDTSVALFVMNARRRLVFFNLGCEQLTGWKPAEVLGQVCDFVTEPDVHSSGALLASLAAPAEVWEGASTTVPIALAVREKEPLHCLIHHYPLTDVDHKVQAALGIIQIGPRKDPQPPTTRSQQWHADLVKLRHLLRQQYGENSLIGRSPAMRRAMEQVKLAVQSSSPVLFVGEAGCGRRHMARVIHYAGSQSQSAFVQLDCRRLPADHLETTLKRMTSADLDPSLQPGTVYFEHVGSLPRDVQPLVIEMIESRSATTCRVMAATHKPLEQFVESDDLISDLHFALTPLTILTPPLRSRTDDLEPLAQFFLEELNRGSAQQVTGFHDDVWNHFHRYNWPGNVSELKMVVTEARQQCSGPTIDASHLPFRFRTGVDRQSIGPPSRKSVVPLDQLLLQVEREQIELALAEARNNKAKAAELLGITRPRLYRRMEVLGIIDDAPTDDENIG